MVASAQESRSQHDNLAKAMERFVHRRVLVCCLLEDLVAATPGNDDRKRNATRCANNLRLRDKLWAQTKRARLEEDNALKEGHLGASAWGDHIRQYVLNPTPYVKDMRSNLAVEGPHAVEQVKMCTRIL